MVCYALELKDENFPPLEKEKKYFPSKYNSELLLPQALLLLYTDVLLNFNYQHFLCSATKSCSQPALSYIAETAKPYAT